MDTPQASKKECFDWERIEEWPGRQHEIRGGGNTGGTESSDRPGALSSGMHSHREFWSIGGPGGRAPNRAMDPACRK